MCRKLGIIFLVGQVKFALNPYMEREGSGHVARLDLMFKACHQEQILLDTQRTVFKIALSGLCEVCLGSF